MVRKGLIVIGIVLIVIIGGLAAVLIMGGGEKPVTIKQKGSDTMLELCQVWAERFHEDHKSISVIVSGGGSGTGITALISKNIDVAQASRQIKQSEIDQAIAAGVTPVEFRVAIDGIAIIVHPSNPITNLTLDQLRGIFNGTYTNWKQIGGHDRAIVAYGRQSTSGTYAFFQEHVLKNEDYRTDMQQLTGNSAIVTAVSNDVGGIGYVGIGYAEKASGIKLLELRNNESSQAYSPLNKNAVLSGEYILSRYLYLYTNGAPTGALKEYISWILTDGQPIAEEIGFYALPAEVVTEELAKLG
ncbi:MAG: PstS family phosphate ABC transporter substrate-binding protein [Methanomassiliicoccales archaeon]|jgi:phosphate transport system substrate-binding protein|nr:PstS family phosphate ABC transporter substrate-binding protein [Methanomassiliicoccales archaeon]